jgi:hypothetical protein
MSCDLGDGNPFRVQTSLASKYALCDNQWHNITALYESEQIAIRIDNQPSITMLAHRLSGKVHSKSPLYIGGLPGKFFFKQCNCLMKKLISPFYLQKLLQPAPCCCEKTLKVASAMWS